MMTVAELRAETRATARARLRDLALEAARTATLEHGWSAVRMGTVAAAIGASRQTLHTEFGTRDNLGHALVMREATMFLDGVAQRLAAHPGDLAGAVSDAAEFALDIAATNPLLQTALSAADTGGDTLLPSLTTRSEPLLHRGDELVGNWVRSQWPDGNPEDIRIMVDTVVRLVVSHAIAPTVAPELAASDIAFVACRCFDYPKQPPAHPFIADS